jgi:tetratricopeptide (TPR) repeat protein
LAHRLDPDFALAYSGLADAHSMGGDWQKAEGYALKALELDDGVAEAHASLGFFKMFRRRNWNRAEDEFSHALKIDPNYSTARQWYALLLAVRGRNIQARAEMQHALELAPFSVNINADLCQIFLLSREYDQAIGQCSKALDMEPDFILALDYLADAYALNGMEAEAVETLLNIVTIDEFRARLAPLSEAAKSSGLKGLLRTDVNLLLKKYPRAGSVSQSCTPCWASRRRPSAHSQNRSKLRSSTSYSSRPTPFSTASATTHATPTCCDA